MRVLAIDPGYERVGIAVLEQSAGNKESVVYSDCFKTPSTLSFHERLHHIGKEIERCIATFSPEACAIEKLYFNSNQKTAMQVSEARGMMLYVFTKNQLPVYEYTPLQVKVAVTGHGRSDKKQVTAMVERLVSLTKGTRHDDEYDAIAVGITCLASERNHGKK